MPSSPGDDFSAMVLARLHGMARTRICRHRCRLCADLPKSNPPPPTAETNVLIAMREKRIADQRERELLLQRMPGAIWLIEEGQAHNLAMTPERLPREPSSRPIDICPVPALEHITWAAVQRLVAHAWPAVGESSLCGKRAKTQADWTRASAPNWCRECQAEVLRRLGRDVYVAGNEIRERGPRGSRKLTRSERA